MSFTDDVKKIEEEKRRKHEEIQNRMPAWAQAVSQLSKYIRAHLRGSPSAKGKALVRVEADVYRVDGIQMDKLTIRYAGKTATATPLPLTHEKVKGAEGAGGCVILEGDNGVAYDLLWDGKSHAVDGHWQIVQTAGGSKSKKTPCAFTTEALDDALRRLFGLIIEA